MKYLFLALAWTILLAALSLMPGKSIPSFSWGSLFQWDKLGHWFFYSILVFLWGKFLQQRSSKGKIATVNLFFLLFCGILYGIALEFAQFKFIPERHFDMFDIIANIIGCFTGLYFIKLILKQN